jgi:hypothetical protein
VRSIRSRIASRLRRPVARVGRLVLLAGLVALPLGSAQATILLFDQQRDAAGQTTVGPSTSGGRLPGDYGDNVTGAVMAVPGGFFTYGDGGEGFTPDVSLEIYSDSGPSDPRVNLWQTGYGDLINVIFGEGPGIEGSPTLNVLFQAAPGYVVDLYGFDLAGFGVDYTIAAVEVLAGAVTLFSAADVLVEGDLSGPRHTAFAFGTPLSASELLLRVDVSNLASGIQDNVGLDSIRFGQTPPAIPEPGTATLLLAGLAATAAQRRCAAARAGSGSRRFMRRTASRCRASAERSPTGHALPRVA